VFGSRCGPQHLELAVGCTLHPELADEEEKKKKEEGCCAGRCPDCSGKVWQRHSRVLCRVLGRVLRRVLCRVLSYIFVKT